MEQQRLREQARKADAAVAQLQRQVADGRDALAAQERDTAAAVAEKDGFARKAADLHAQLVAAQQETAKQRTANEEVRPGPC